ncbi:MAG TPA: hypothetical protein VFQ88_11005 [Nevskiaceae bacterium]|nr:hypothetical protein [Nevskiaceae bacterium]
MNRNFAWAAAAVFLLGVPLAATAGVQPAHHIEVSLSRVDSNLSCTQVGKQVHVRFDARDTGFEPTHVALLLNGVPVTGSRREGHWPRVTLAGGLSPGRNTVELVAQRPDGSAVDRSIVVKVGNSVQSSDGVTLGCTGIDDRSTAVAPVQSTASAVAYSTPTTVVYPVQPVYTGWPYAVGWGGWGDPYWGGFYNAWAPVGLSIGVGYGGGWRHGWGGHHWRGGHGHWRGGGHWHGGGGHWHHR